MVNLSILLYIFCRLEYFSLNILERSIDTNPILIPNSDERKIANERQARLTADLKLTVDYKNSIIPAEFEITEKDLPNYLKRTKTESLSQWRDRLLEVQLVMPPRT